MIESQTIGRTDSLVYKNTIPSSPITASSSTTQEFPQTSPQTRPSSIQNSSPPQSSNNIDQSSRTEQGRQSKQKFEILKESHGLDTSGSSFDINYPETQFDQAVNRGETRFNVGQSSNDDMTDDDSGEMCIEDELVQIGNMYSNGCKAFSKGAENFYIETTTLMNENPNLSTKEKQIILSQRMQHIQQTNSLLYNELKSLLTLENNISIEKKIKHLDNSDHSKLSMFLPIQTTWKCNEWNSLQKAVLKTDKNDNNGRVIITREMIDNRGCVELYLKNDSMQRINVSVLCRHHIFEQSFCSVFPNCSLMWQDMKRDFVMLKPKEAINIRIPVKLLLNLLKLSSKSSLPHEDDKIFRNYNVDQIFSEGCNIPIDLFVVATSYTDVYKTIVNMRSMNYLLVGKPQQEKAALNQKKLSITPLKLLCLKTQSDKQNIP